MSNDFVKYLFSIKYRNAQEGGFIGAATIRKNSNSVVQKTKCQMIIIINAILSIVCISSFVYIIVFTILYRDCKIPDIIQNTFSLTLGYFASALLTFIEKK